VSVHLLTAGNRPGTAGHGRCAVAKIFGAASVAVFVVSFIYRCPTIDCDSRYCCVCVLTQNPEGRSYECSCISREVQACTLPSYSWIVDGHCTDERAILRPASGLWEGAE